MHIAMGAISLLTPLTGIGQYTYHLSRAIADLDHDVHLYYGAHWSPLGKGGELVEHHPLKPRTYSSQLMSLAKRGVRRLLPNSRDVARWAMQKTFNQGAATQRFDLYHETNFIPMQFKGPTVITVHDLSCWAIPETHPPARVAYMHKHLPKALDQAQRIIVVSAHVKGELMKWMNISAEKIRVVHNGLADTFQPVPLDTCTALLKNYHLPEKYFLYLGTIEPRKNILTVLQAHQSLPKVLRSQCPVVVVGAKGWLNDEIHQFMSEMEKNGELIRLGYVPDEHLPAVISGALASLYPSFYEGFGMPPLEAMACGVPVIASNQTSIPEVLGSAADLVDPRDVDGFCGAMMRIWEDGSHRQDLIEKGRSRAAEFSWHKCAIETVAVYRELLG